MRQQNISMQDAQTFIDKYIENGGTIAAASEGVLGLGVVILQGLKSSFVIMEKALNEWSTGHIIINFYGQTVPQKYFNLCEAENL